MLIFSIVEGLLIVLTTCPNELMIVKVSVPSTVLIVAKSVVFGLGYTERSNSTTSLFWIPK